MSEADYEQLSYILDLFPHEQAMNLEMLDGFFTALHCTPEITLPSAFLPDTWGGGDMPGEEVFEDEQQLNTFLVNNQSFAFKMVRILAERLAKTDELLIGKVSEVNRLKVTTSVDEDDGFSFFEKIK